ncbi:MAG TPA: glycoside hydrolase family 99-like domain-containing protein [Parapedobacter sp.]|uniref:glycosyltransferase WbsX family protein n=1 Tax=Parapedobacter sp. TaxID=1958893 RepID=UPI002BD15DF5|nr:glycoside hydrolase family 99-like domain-containing protein [Parapedobacter sp.]HWK58540.1 glycoside hydrolase family 99-like domain-containing protein [Parapedobacter sp.]
MKNKWSRLSAISAGVLMMACGAPQEQKQAQGDELIVAAYYFPNYHTGDARHSQNPEKGPNWSEWELVKTATPRFEGHRQPLVPEWGYLDEKDPAVMAKKIQTAVDHGVNCFIFDWYMYEDEPFLEKALDEGFLKAENTDKINFALMWANHDWMDIHPYTYGEEHKILYPGKVSPERFEEIGDHLIERYFQQANYLKIDGKPYFSVYDVQRFIEGFGTVEAAKAAMDRLRDKAVAAGLGGIHWNLVAWGAPILPGEEVPVNTPGLIRELGFDSATSYVWIHHVDLPEVQTDYNVVRDAYVAHWERVEEEYGVPYYPNVTMGWDATPRCDVNVPWQTDEYPYMNTIGNNTPENFKAALQLTKDRLLANPDGPRMLNINCWNEWTEGSYLEPDTVSGMAYLEAVKAVFR